MSADHPEKPETSPRPLVLLPRPIEPDPQECCRRGCEPCIFDYYRNALERWEAKVAELSAKARDPS